MPHEESKTWYLLKPAHYKAILQKTSGFKDSGINFPCSFLLVYELL